MSLTGLPPGTKQIWDAFKKHLEVVVKQQPLDYFNDDGIKAFIRHLRVNAEMQENSVQKHYLNLRWFLNWSIRRGYASEKEIGKIQPKFKLVDKPIIFLTKEEWLKLYNYVIPANGSKVKLHNYAGKEYEKVVHDAGPLAKTRDMFCFCAFTSLRYSTSTLSPRRFLPSTKISASRMVPPCQSSPTRR